MNKKFLQAFVLISPLFAISTENVNAMGDEGLCIINCDLDAAREKWDCSREYEKAPNVDPAPGALSPANIFANCIKKAEAKQAACTKKCSALSGWEKL